jgi:phosphotransacetylase
MYRPAKGIEPEHLQRIPSEDPLVKAMTQVAKEEADSRPSRQEPNQQPTAK